MYEVLWINEGKRQRGRLSVGGKMMQYWNVKKENGGSMYLRVNTSGDSCEYSTGRYRLKCKTI